MTGHGSKYIDRYFPNAEYSEPLWLVSKTTGLIQVVIGDYADRGAVAIYVWSIVIQHTTLSQPFVLSDNAGIPLLNSNSIGAPYIYFEYVFKSPTLNLSTNNNNVIFAVGFQYITLGKKL